MNNLVFLRGILASRSVAAVAVMSGVPESAVRNIKMGRTARVSAEVMERLVEAFRLEADAVIKWASREPVEYPFRKLLESVPVRDVRSGKQSLVKDNPPNLEQISDYMSSLPNTVNPAGEAAKFLFHYASNGWKVGRNFMVDWHKAASGWMFRAREYQSSLERGGHRHGDQSTVGRSTAKAAGRYRAGKRSKS